MVTHHNSFSLFSTRNFPVILVSLKEAQKNTHKFEWSTENNAEPFELLNNGEICIIGVLL